LDAGAADGEDEENGMDKESRNALITIGGVLVLLLVISVAFSGRSGDSIYDGPAIHQQYQAADATPAEAPEPEDVAVPGEPEGEATEPVAEVPAAEAAADEPTAEAAAEAAEAPAEEAPAEEAPAEEPAAEEAPAEEAPAEAAPVETAALAGDPEAGARTWRQCQACHQIGAGAQNRVGPQLTGVVGRPKAASEGFNYSSALAARGQEGQVWTVEALSAYLADPRGYIPGTTMAFAGLRNPADIENVIAYIASHDE
jgi:cytochrome c